MKAGDLVSHRGTGKIYLIVEDGGDAKALVGVLLDDGSLGFMAENWLDVVYESR
tara:strand:+ start:238 stop:399 length:162 start_codon:yes stop_codon:yes gene_type:complete